MISLTHSIAFLEINTTTCANLYILNPARGTFTRMNQKSITHFLGSICLQLSLSKTSSCINSSSSHRMHLDSNSQEDTHCRQFDKKMLTADNSIRRAWRMADIRYLCRQHEETIHHLFNTCPFTKCIKDVVQDAISNLDIARASSWLMNLAHKGDPELGRERRRQIGTLAR